MLSSGFLIENSSSPQDDWTFVVQRTSIDEDGNEVTETRIHNVQVADKDACDKTGAFIGRAYELGLLKF